MQLTFINHEEWGIQASWFEDLLPRFQELLMCPEGDLNVIFVNDVYIRSLNKAYRDQDKPTDVLSFPYLHSPDFEETQLIGEIYISVETTQSQAEKAGHDLPFELRKLLVHGVCHIFGYDHVDEDDYKVMHALECSILQIDLPFIPRDEAEKL